MLRGLLRLLSRRPVRREAARRWCRALIGNPDEGLQLIARRRMERLRFRWASRRSTGHGRRLYAARVGVLNDLYVMPESRGTGTGRASIAHCLKLVHERGAEKLVWETAPDNVTAQRLYDGIGAEKSTWITYELDA